MSRRAGGFTLIEVLLATVLLAAGLALALTTLRARTCNVPPSLRCRLACQ